MQPRPRLRGAVGGPLWRQVHDDLARRIAQGEFADRFPTDRELTQQYSVSRHTVREAVGRLRARGIVERHRGRGSFVSDASIVTPAAGLSSLFRAVEGQGITQRSKVLTLDTVVDDDVACRLGIPADTPLIRLERLRLAGQLPIALDCVWLPASIGARLLQVDFRSTALYAELEALGAVIDRIEEDVVPVVAEPELAGLLALEDDEALLKIRRIGYSQGERIECRLTLLRGQQVTYRSAWDLSTRDAT